MRKYDIDNIRWITVLLVVLYHVIYMYNGIVTSGVVGDEEQGIAIVKGKDIFGG